MHWKRLSNLGHPATRAGATKGQTSRQISTRANVIDTDQVQHLSACLRQAALMPGWTCHMLCVPLINQCRMMVIMGAASILNHDSTSSQKLNTAELPSLTWCAPPSCLRQQGAPEDTIRLLPQPDYMRRNLGDCLAYMVQGPCRGRDVHEAKALTPCPLHVTNEEDAALPTRRQTSP